MTKLRPNMWTQKELILLDFKSFFLTCPLTLLSLRRFFFLNTLLIFGIKVVVVMFISTAKLNLKSKARVCSLIIYENK